MNRQKVEDKIMDIKNHRLKNSGFQFKESPNHSGKMKDGQPDSIVIHYTAGGSAESAVRTLSNPARKASAHLVIGRDGSVTQLVPFDTVAWHAGRSSYEGRSGFNNFSIGIEIDNAGKLTKTEEGHTSWFGKDYPAKDVIRATHRNEHQPSYWHKYTEQQINLVFDVCSVLIDTYAITLIVGHEEIAPSRKTDPGPAFPLDKLRERLLQTERAEDGSADGSADEETMQGNVGVVTASKLNIRSEPWLQAKTAAPPIPRGTMLKILDETDDWYQVDVITRGWVSKKFVST
ncbi:MAG: N-acetylmuramoyl-L-alanine amidase [Caldithrix sp.]|nr:N-acetylmuramoyl-L-alanine amidase [Caldithrix sp.]